MNLQQCLEQIAMLPDGTSVFLPESQAEKDLLANTKLHYQGLSLWLKNLVGGENQHPDAVQKFWMLQPFAEIWKVRFDLIKGVYSRCTDFAEIGFSNPSELWLWCIHEEANRQRESIFDGSILQKTEYLDKGTNMFKEINDPTTDTPIPELVKDPGLELVKGPYDPTLTDGDLTGIDFLENPFLAVMLQAQYLNVTSTNFWDDYYHPWIKAENRALREIRRNPKIQLLNLINDQIHITEQGKNLKTSQIVKPPMRFGAKKKQR
jgi:hypothetical protein